MAVWHAKMARYVSFVMDGGYLEHQFDIYKMIHFYRLKNNDQVVKDFILSYLEYMIFIVDLQEGYNFNRQENITVKLNRLLSNPDQYLFNDKGTYKRRGGI